jgi:hypothetical protein
MNKKALSEAAAKAFIDGLDRVSSFAASVAATRSATVATSSPNVALPITFEQIDKLMEDADRRQYNRNIVKHFPRNASWEIVPTMEHRHKGGKSCEPHIRCALTHNGQLGAFIDVAYPTFASVLGSVPVIGQLNIVNFPDCPKDASDPASSSGDK